MTEWTEVSDCLPKPGRPCVVIATSMKIAWLAGELWWTIEGPLVGVRYWIELPEHPDFPENLWEKTPPEKR